MTPTNHPPSTTSPVASLAEMPEGKRRLMRAAMELAEDGRTISSMGLRELARLAELNPNTFYRHFEDLDDLGRQIGAVVKRALMHDIREARRRSTEAPDVTGAVVRLYLDRVQAEPGSYRIGLNEQYGPSPAMRRMVRTLLDDIADESVAQLRESGLSGGMDDVTLRAVTATVTRLMFDTAGDLLERPDARQSIERDLARTIRWIFTGALSDPGHPPVAQDHDGIDGAASPSVRDRQ